MNFLYKIFKRKSRSTQSGIFLDKLKNLLEFSPNDMSIYEQAFTHRSVNKLDENGKQINYERLEFLGDAILGTAIAAHLYSASPNGDEGYLTKMRSKLVSRDSLNRVGKKLQLIDFLDCKIQKSQVGDNIHGNILEALIGAIFLDKSFVHCEKFIKSYILKEFGNIEELEGRITSYKSLFIEYCQKEKKSFKFESFEDDGCENIKYFGVKLYYNENVIAKARATSKKKAEEKAAQRAYFALQKNIISKH
nr:ribonuclease III [uncultured Flavobacterium sp.]